MSVRAPYSSVRLTARCLYDVTCTVHACWDLVCGHGSMQQLLNVCRCGSSVAFVARGFDNILSCQCIACGRHACFTVFVVLFDGMQSHVHVSQPIQPGSGTIQLKLSLVLSAVCSLVQSTLPLVRLEMFART